MTVHCGMSSAIDYRLMLTRSSQRHSMLGICHTISSSAVLERSRFEDAFTRGCYSPRSTTLVAFLAWEAAIGFDELRLAMRKKCFVGPPLCADAVRLAPI